jgi:hypothetical protein
MDKLSLTPLLALMLIGCQPIYQVVNTIPTGPDRLNETNSFANDHVQVSYDLWSKKGEMSFMISNLTDSSIYIDWNRSHLIYNGLVYDYWHDSETMLSSVSVYSVSSASGFAQYNVQNLGGTVSGTKSEELSGRTLKNAVSTTQKVKPKRIVHIPPHSAIVASTLRLWEKAYYSCDFPLRSAAGGSNISYTETDSPLRFRNFITYSFEEQVGSCQHIDNGFFVNNISNMNLYKFRGNYEKVRTCRSSGFKYMKTVYTFPYRSPLSYYIIHQ